MGGGGHSLVSGGRCKMPAGSGLQATGSADSGFLPRQLNFLLGSTSESHPFGLLRVDGVVTIPRVFDIKNSSPPVAQAMRKVEN
jgi:hypothetical protein